MRALIPLPTGSPRGLDFRLEKDFRTREYFIIMSVLNNMIQNSIKERVL
jgi:hypothetical protein